MEDALLRNMAIVPLALVVASCAAGPYPRVIEWQTQADGSVCKVEQLDPFMQRRQCVPQAYFHPPSQDQIYNGEKQEAGAVNPQAQDLGASTHSVERTPAPPQNDEQAQDDDQQIDPATRSKLDALKARLEEQQPMSVQGSQPTRRVQRNARPVQQAPATVSQSAVPPATATPAPAPAEPTSPAAISAAPSLQPAAQPNRRPPDAQKGPVY
jgi:hypothetical protein